MSKTTPSAPYLGIEIQSPQRSISFAESWTEATNPRMASLKTNIKTAADAPNPARILTGDLPINIETTRITTMTETTSFSIWTNPRTYFSVCTESRSLNTSMTPIKKYQIAANRYRQRSLPVATKTVSPTSSAGKSTGMTKRKTVGGTRAASRRGILFSPRIFSIRAKRRIFILRTICPSRTPTRNIRRYVEDTTRKIRKAAERALLSIPQSSTGSKSEIILSIFI